jgi:hypothetical protein
MSPFAFVGIFPFFLHLSSRRSIHFFPFFSPLSNAPQTWNRCVQRPMPVQYWAGQQPGVQQAWEQEPVGVVLAHQDQTERDHGMKDIRDCDGGEVNAGNEAAHQDKDDIRRSSLRNQFSGKLSLSLTSDRWRHLSPVWLKARRSRCSAIAAACAIMAL